MSLGRTLFLRGLVAVAISLSIGCIGDPCDDAWEPDLGRGFVCADLPAKCTQVQSQLDRKLGFVARMATVDAKGKPVSASTLKQRASCISDFIKTRGAYSLVVAPDNTSITATSTFRRMAPTLEFKAVADFTMTCGTEDGCSSCMALAADQCTANAFCSAFQSCPP